MLVDTHCHVHFPAYDDDRKELIERAREQNMRLITIGTQQKTSKAAIACAEQYDNVYASVGLHPGHTIKQTYEDPEEGVGATPEEFDRPTYEALARHPKCVAIGECGLDFYRLPDNEPIEQLKAKQIQALNAQIKLADDCDLPLVIHCRDAYEEQLAIHQAHINNGGLKRGGVIHCFAGTLEHAQAFTKQGFYLGFNGIITFPPRKSDQLIDGLTPLQYVVREMPIETILLETDAPYLTPMPYRGKRNEPTYTRYVAEKIAEIKNLSVEEVIEQTGKNAQLLFRIS